MAQNNTTRWTAPTFSFNTEDQPAAWREFYTRVIDYLETIDIDPEQEDQHKRGWKQIEMMFTGEDRQALQTMIDNNIITPADQHTPIQALKAIQTTIKDEEHYWHYRDEVLSNIRQQPGERVHALNRITTKHRINSCSFQDQQTTETMKIMLLQHAIRYHKAHDWIRLQDPAALTYKSLLQHCKQLEQCCKQFQKAQLKGRAELASLTVASTRTSIHQDAITTHPNHNNCYRCRYSHTIRECPAIGQRCHNCNGMNHFSALCKSRNHREYRKYGRQSRHSQREPYRSRVSRRSSSRSSSRLSSRSTSHHRCTRRHRSPTPHPIDTLTIAGLNAAPTNNTEDNSTQLKKCKSRHPTPLPAKPFSLPTFSDTEDTSDTASEISIVIHSQDEDESSTDYSTISPP